jgi:acylphosphatase
MKAVKLTVAGRVQMVGYRRYVVELAQEAGLAGFVKNEKDGSVSVWAQGDDEKLTQFLGRIRNPPLPTVVKEINEVSARPLTTLKHFGIRFGSLVEELQEGLGVMQTEFRDYRQEFRDYKVEFRGFAERTDENFKMLSQRYEEISEKLTKIMETLVEESKRTREMLEVMRTESKQLIGKLDESLRLLREAVDRLPRNT